MCPLERKEIIVAHGHENVSATHGSTLEITKEPDLSTAGNCIIAVSADRAMDDLSLEFKEILRGNNARLIVSVEVDGVTETINACGSSGLILAHPTSIVLRKSRHICSRTLAIQADKSACDLSREIVKKLRDPSQEVRVTLVVRV